MPPSQTIEPDLTIDTRGRNCPLPVIEATRHAEGLARGAVLEVLSDCTGAYADLQAWARQTGRELLEVVAHEGGGYAYLLRNGDRWAPDTVLDMRGRTCPVPVVEAERALQGMAAGQVLKLLGDCRGFDDDVRTWTHNTGRELLGTVPGPSGSAASYIRG